MGKTILVIDGMYLVFSSFYSSPNMRTPDGKPTGALYGFINRIENLINTLEPEKIAVAFDSRGKGFRHELYPQYKAKRQAPPEELLEQLPAARKYLELRGIDALEEPGFEADDIIAAISRNDASPEWEVVIFSTDKDLFQLVGDHVSVYHPKVKQKLNRDGIKEFFGVYPDQIVDFLSMMGDSSDNIPGIPGVGEKTAKKLMEQFQTVENMYASLDDVNERLRKKLVEQRDSFELSKRLIDLSDIPGLPEKYPIRDFENECPGELVSFYRKWAFSSFVKRLENAGVQENESGFGYHVVTSAGQMDDLVKKIKKTGRFAFDVETTGIEFFSSSLVGISIGFEDSGYYIPFLYPENSDPPVEITLEDFRRRFGDIFSDPAILKTGHNIKFDCLHLEKNGIRVRGIGDDSMIKHYLLYPNRGSHRLKDLSFEFMNYRQMEFDELTGKGKDRIPLPEIDISRLSRYCIDDSILSWKLSEYFERFLKERSLTEVYRDIEIPLVDVLIRMETAGVKVDPDFLRRASTGLEEKIEQVEKEIFQAAGYTFNLNSSQQLGELLFEKMRLPAVKKTRKTKSHSTDIEVLKGLSQYPVVEKVIRYRTYKKLLSTYVHGLMESIDENRRIHTSFNQTVTATGRLSSSGPNLQNIPVGEVAGINIREAFVADEGMKLLSADYSQIELRVMAHFSRDDNLIDAFLADEDIHQYTADKVFPRSENVSDRERRRRAKIINFSVLYGSGPYSLSKELGVSFGEAREFIDMYFEKYSGVKGFMEQVVADAMENPEIRTISGRLRPIPEIISSNRTVHENGKRMAVNSVIQGSAADIIKLAMIRIQPELAGMKSRLILQVHDELVFEYPPDEEKKLVRLVKEQMERVVTLRVPLTVTLKTGSNWGAMTGLSV